METIARCFRTTVWKRVLPGLLLVLAAAGGGLRAQENPLTSPLNSETPINIAADRLDVDNRNRTFVFKGNVKVVQGTTVITSEQLKILYSTDGSPTSPAANAGGRIRDIEASGNVVILFDGRTAKSDRALYSAEQDTLTLLGDKATVIDGPNTIRGSKITLYRAKGRITVEGSRDGQGKGRVEVLVFP
ncbi:MAG: lipopolysaccharide transport periplasmic protein LptA, partial [Desulfobacterales bacterium]